MASLERPGNHLLSMDLKGIDPQKTDYHDEFLGWTWVMECFVDSLAIAINLLRDYFELGDRADKLTAESRLSGGLQGFDSMSVVGLIETAEKQLNCMIDEDEIVADAFETVGSFAEFLKSQHCSGK